MAKYKFNVPSTASTVTAATWSKVCISGSSFSVSNVPGWIVTSTTTNALVLDIAYNYSTVNKRISEEMAVSFSAGTTECTGNSIIVEQEKAKEVITIEYTATTKLNVNLALFTPTATAETFSGGAGRIEFDSNVTAIGSAAFKGKGALTAIRIPNTVTSFGYDSFSACTSLTGITIPDSVTTIGSSSFSDCVSLKSLEIPTGVTKVEGYLCYNCTSLSSVTIPSGVTEIAWHAFDNCPGMRKIELNCVMPPTLDSDAFRNTADCPIYVPESALSTYWTQWATGTNYYPYVGRIIAHIADNCVVYKAAAKIPDGKMERIKDGMYNAATGGSKLTYQSHTFTNGVGKITYSGTIKSIRNNAFHTTDIQYFIIPEKVERIHQEVFASCRSLDSIFIPDSVKGLCNSASDFGCDIFSDTPMLKSCVVGSGCTQIGYQCWATGVSRLTGLTFYSSSAPTLDHGNTFEHTNNCPIYVPCNRVSSYKGTNIWRNSDIVNRIKAIPPCTS